MNNRKQEDYLKDWQGLEEFGGGDAAPDRTPLP